MARWGNLSIPHGAPEEVSEKNSSTRFVIVGWNGVLLFFCIWKGYDVVGRAIQYAAQLFQCVKCDILILF